MPEAHDVLAGWILAALMLYALSGGADFGGGVWDLLARGPRADDQRRLIERAIGPIWEANHVWLIAVIVILFSCFPAAYQGIAIALHLPLSVMLAGIVLRGAAFVFRAYDTHRPEVWHAWSRAFATGSVVAPFMLGVCLGTAASDGLIAEGVAQPGVQVWLAPFPLTIGALCVAIFAFLAAVYLTVEAAEPLRADPLRSDRSDRSGDRELEAAFRRRALASSAAVTVLAWAAFALSADAAPHLRAGLWTSWWAVPFQLTTGVIGAAIVHALWTWRFRRARALAVVQVVGVIGGFGAAQHPFLFAPDLTFEGAIVAPEVARAVATALSLGFVGLIPAYAWMLRVFKAR